MAPGRLGSLQALRGAAALMVLAFHLKIHAAPAHLGADPLWDGFAMGYAGVEIFFVLSGFVMMHAHGAEIGTRGAALPFLRRRILRIYPMFWAVLGGILIARWALEGTLPPAGDLVRAALLLPETGEPVMRVAWTLSFEMAFYLLFGLAIAAPWLGLAVAALWAGGMLAASAGAAGGMLLTAYPALFAMGMGAATLWRRPGVAAAAACLLAGLAVFLGTGLSEALGGTGWPKGARTLLYGVGGTGIVIGLAALERHGRLAAPRLAEALGDASYAIYLVHLPALALGGRALAGLAPGMDPALAAVALGTGALGAGILAHLLVERPLLAALRRPPRLRLAMQRG